MGGPKKGPSAQTQFNASRQRLEKLLSGDSEELSGLTAQTKNEFQRRIEKLAGKTAATAGSRERGEQVRQGQTGNVGVASENIAELGRIEEELKQAQAGEGKFAERQALQERQTLLKDRPGRRQIFSF